MSKPRKKKPGGLSPAGVQSVVCLDEQLEAARHKREDIRPSSSWTVEPDDHDGFKVHIGAKGHVVLTQAHPFDREEVKIVLHPDEARRLLEILPTAIDEAIFSRHGGAPLE